MTDANYLLQQQLMNALYNADKLNNFRDRDVLRYLANSLKKWGALLRSSRLCSGAYGAQYG